MKVKGEVQIVLRDKDTDDVIFEHRQENIITEYFYQRLWESNAIAPLNIVVTSAVMESTRYTSRFPGDGTNNVMSRFPDSFVPSNGNWNVYTAPTVSSDGLLQFAGRYSAPTLGTSRTIRSVGLGGWGFNSNPQASSTASSGDQTYYLSATYPDYYFMPAIAFLKLATPCIQTDTQVLDVYYRLYFPYNSVNNEVPLAMWQKFLYNWCAAPSSYGNDARISPFKIPTLKSYDSGKLPMSYVGWVSDAYQQNSWVPTLSNTSGINLPSQSKYFNYTDPTFTDNQGYIFNSISWSNYGGFPSSYSNFAGTNKIGNLIGQATWLSVNTASPFLDVDNLPTGTGKIYLGGTYSPSGTPAAPGLYYTYLLPERTTVKITTSGNVGVSNYKLIRQKWVGYKMLSAYPSGIFYNRFICQAISPLCGSIPFGSPSQYLYDYNLTLIGDVTDTKFAGQQISACERFDDSSFIVVKKDEIILYNVGAADYWRFTAAYTNINQVAVMNNKIYIGCRDTGLWVVDPYNSLVVTSLAAPGGGIDLSKCYGVAKGFGNLVWAVGNNCLASFDGTTWTKYDSTTSPAFTMTGVSDSNWSNIEYLKVDELSATNQMLLVRKYNATVDPTLLGVWWSTAGTTTNTGAETQSTGSQYGRPRLNKKHVGGQENIWAVYSGSRYRLMTFGTTTFTTIASPAGDDVGAAPAEWSNTIFQSINFVKNSSNQTRLMLFRPGDVEYYQTNYSGYLLRYNMYLINGSGTITDSLLAADTALTTPVYGFTAWAGNFTRTTSSGTYGGTRDQSFNFILCPGVMVYGINKYGNSADGIGWGGTVIGLVMYGLDKTPNGGALSYLARQEYGWDGSQWVLGGVNGRPTHTSTNALSAGVTVRFEDGAAGTSFVTPNVYSYLTCDGIPKDNATRANYASTLYYYRQVYKNQTDLQSSTVPAATAQATGVVGVDFTRASGNVSVNVDNEVIFPGLNMRQYAMGDKEVTGDFVINVDVTNLTATNVRQAMFVGVSRAEYINYGQPQFGFFTANNALYWYDIDTWASIGISGVTSLVIRRVAGSLELVRNGTVVRVHSTNIIRAADYRLSIMFGMWDYKDTAIYGNSGVRCPKLTIASNGSDNGVYMGNSVTNTGVYHPRYFGVDVWTANAFSVKLNGVAATVKNNGTAPAAGEVTVDGIKGIMYFNSADQGKTISANYLYQAS